MSTQPSWQPDPPLRLGLGVRRVETVVAIEALVAYCSPRRTASRQVLGDSAFCTEEIIDIYGRVSPQFSTHSP